jgi:hypothetical protein
MRRIARTAAIAALTVSAVATTGACGSLSAKPEPVDPNAPLVICVVLDKDAKKTQNGPLDITRDVKKITVSTTRKGGVAWLVLTDDNNERRLGTGTVTPNTPDTVELEKAYDVQACVKKGMQGKQDYLPLPGDPSPSSTS